MRRGIGATRAYNGGLRVSTLGSSGGSCNGSAARGGYRLSMLVSNMFARQIGTRLTVRALDVLQVRSRTMSATMRVQETAISLHRY